MLFARSFLETMPLCKEKPNYNVPYYYGTRRICHIFHSPEGIDEHAITQLLKEVVEIDWKFKPSGKATY